MGWVMAWGLRLGKALQMGSGRVLECLVSWAARKEQGWVLTPEQRARARAKVLELALVLELVLGLVQESAQGPALVLAQGQGAQG